MTLAPGQILQDRYTVAAPLGQGGMAAVYKAVDKRLNVTVAIKEMIPIEGIDAQTLTQFRQQFEQEAMVLARLNHPHLVRVTDFFEAGTNAYLVMDFAEGENLADLIARDGAFSEMQVLEWAGELLDALTYCHGQGVIHRDIKPQNVIIRPDGRAVLVDFGLVKLWNPNDPRTKTVMRGMGTPEYSPPEQYDANQGHTDPRSDIYSLGATLYHALTGQAPPTATLRIADPECFNQPWGKVRGVRPQTQVAIARALELARQNRWQSAPEMAAGLGLMLHRKPTTGELKRNTPVRRERRRLPGWVWGVGIMLLLALCSGGAVVARLVNRDSTPTPTATYTLTPAPTRAATSTAKPTATSTSTPRPTSTAAVTQTPDLEATSTATRTPSATPSRTPTTRPTLIATKTSALRPTSTPIPPTQPPAPTTPPTPEPTTPPPTEPPTPEPTTPPPTDPPTPEPTTPPPTDPPTPEPTTPPPP